MKKTAYIIIAIIIVIIIAIVIWLAATPKPATAPQTSLPASNATSVSTGTVPESAQGIENYVNGIDVSGASSSFNDINNSINNL